MVAVVDPIFLRILSAADSDLDDARVVDASDTDVLESLIINFSLLGVLNDDVDLTRQKRPENISLWLLGRVRAEVEFWACVVEIRMCWAISSEDAKEETAILHRVANSEQAEISTKVNHKGLHPQ